MKPFDYEYPLQDPENRNHYFYSFDQYCWKCCHPYMTSMVKGVIDRSKENKGAQLYKYDEEAPIPLPGTCITNREALEKNPAAVLFLEGSPGHPPWKRPDLAPIWEAWAEEVHNQRNVTMFYNALVCHYPREAFINLFGELSNDSEFWKRNPGLLEKIKSYK